MTREGLIFHAKHAFMPNSLGYCGPDERGTIQQELEGGRPGDGLARTLKKFEAAYPFLTLIARNTGKGPFDYAVPEAYWIGNQLLEKVPAPEFYTFSHHELRGKDPKKVSELFKGRDGDARPHHTFNVMSTYAASTGVDGPDISNESERKLSTLIDSCRISWGRVLEVGEGELKVEYRPLSLAGGRLALAPPGVKRVRYNRAVAPFDSLKKGDAVSLHWDYACDVLTRRQEANIAKYTLADLRIMNRFLSARKT